MCRPVEHYGDPLLIDWKPEQRADLQAVMKDAVAVVEYRCNTLRLLKDCSLEGTYGFIGVNHKEQVFQLKDEEELRANLPTNGGALTGQLGADLQNGAAVDVAIVNIGRQSTPRAAATRRELKGSCAGATHFVRRAHLGAFAMQGTTGQAKATTVAQVFAASGAKSIHSVDGNPAACAAAKVDSPSAPPNCAAPFRIEIVAIDASSSTATELQSPKCPKGLARSGGKCTVPTFSIDADCSYDDAPTCAQECKKGNAVSCGRLGWAYAHGYSLPKDEARAVDLLNQGCDKGYDEACSALGQMYVKGNSVLKADVAKATQLFERSCNAGISRGCHNMGVFYREGMGVSKDLERALQYFTRACESGLAVGCAGVADVLEPKDVARSVLFYRRACKGGYAEACKDLERLDKK